MFRVSINQDSQPASWEGEWADGRVAERITAALPGTAERVIISPSFPRNLLRWTSNILGWLICGTFSILYWIITN